MLASTPTPKRDSMDAATSIPSKSSILPPSNTSTRPTPTLSSLPTPLLHQILTPLLSTTHISSFLPPISYTPSPPSSPTLTFDTSRAPFPLSTPLFYVSKVFSRKALTFFHAHNLFVRLDLRTSVQEAQKLLLESGIIFFASGDESVGRCVGHAMDVRIVERRNEGGAGKKVVFPGEYVPRLVEYLAGKAEKWGAEHEILITVRNAYDGGRARVQGDLVEGFRVLSGVAKVQVNGEVLGGYAAGLEKCMMGGKLTGRSWVESVKEMLRFAEVGNDQEQEEYFRAAIISLTSAYRMRPELMHSDASLAKSIQRSRWTAELGLARVLHRRFTSTPHPATSKSKPFATAKTAQLLLEAEKSAESALSLATDSPSPAANPWVRSLPVEVVPPNRLEWFADGERGESWYVLGLVHMALGEFLFAAGDLERAIRLMGEGGEKGEAGEAFARAREGIDWGVRPGVGLRRAAWVARREGCEV